MTDNTVLALSGMAIKGVAYALYLAPCIAATHNMVPPNMRAFASAILLFVLNIIGLGLGPLLIGLISDILTPEYGMTGLRYSLLITAVTTSIGFVLFLAAARRVKADMRAEQIDVDILKTT
jgi:MFS family permease